jgi:BirA family biotin operon repressor/biotin-[acetyl-CoA-carboxylase] ligase
MKHKILEYDIATSSNDIARELAQNGAKHGTTIVVNSQTKGRGRSGRAFISNSTNGLYMSIILRPELPPQHYNTLTALACVSVVNAIEKTTDKAPKIKWVNDIYINDRKICGILTESKISYGKFEYIICGIGINISPPQNGFDAEISKIAGAIFESVAPNDYKMTLCNAILDEFFAYFDNLEKKSYMPKYKEYSMIIGSEVDVYWGNEIISGIACDIGEDAELIIKCQNGTTRAFNSGEARVRKAGEGI